MAGDGLEEGTPEASLGESCWPVVIASETSLEGLAKAATGTCDFAKSRHTAFEAVVLGYENCTNTSRWVVI